MANLPNLGGHTDGGHITQAQSQKEVTSNGLDDLLDNSVNAVVDVVCSDGGNGFVTVTEDDYLAAGVLHLIPEPGSPGLSADFNLVVTTASKRFVVWNQSGFTATVEGAGSPTTSVVIENGELALLHSLAGETIIKVATSKQFYDIAFFLAGVPTFDAVGGLFVATRALTIPAGATGSQAYADTAPGGAEIDQIFDIQRNGSSVGSITFTASSNTGTFSVASDIVLAVGDRLAIVNPSNPSPDEDTVVANVGVTFKVLI